MPKITIEYALPEGSNRDDVADFVVDAIESWGGQRHPDDPLFGSLRGHLRNVVVNGKNYNHLMTVLEDQ